MERMSFSNSNELVSNYIDVEAMLAHFLNWYRHNQHSEWMAEYRVKVVPDRPYYGTWYIESSIVGRSDRLTPEDALQVVYDYESAVNSDLAQSDMREFKQHLYYKRWSELGASPEYSSA